MPQTMLHRTPNYAEHLNILEEWNEGCSFTPTATAQLSTELGTQIVQDVECRTHEYLDGVFIGLGPALQFQVHAIYGDEDEVKRLVVHGNDRTEVLIDETVRA